MVEWYKDRKVEIFGYSLELVYFNLQLKGNSPYSPISQKASIIFYIPLKDWDILGQKIEENNNIVPFYKESEGVDYWTIFRVNHWKVNKTDTTTLKIELGLQEAHLQECLKYKCPHCNQYGLFGDWKQEETLRYLQCKVCGEAIYDWVDKEKKKGVKKYS